MIDGYLITKYLPALLKGAGISIFISTFSLLIGIGSGLAIAVAHFYGCPILRTIFNVYLGIIRGTPMLVQIGFLYYFLTSTGMTSSGVIAAVIAIGLNSGAYMSEVFRSGMQAVSAGQFEAAQTLGISKFTIIRRIILPQALRITLPSLGNEAVTLVKDSSLASTIGVVELYRQASIMMSVSYDAITSYAALALFYIVMTSVVSAVFSYIERKSKYYA